MKKVAKNNVIHCCFVCVCCVIAGYARSRVYIWYIGCVQASYLYSV